MKLGKIKVTNRRVKGFLEDQIIDLYNTQQEAEENKPAAWRLWPDGIGVGIILESGKSLSIKRGFEIWSEW